MKAITIANQPWLSMKRTVSITVDGIRYRLFRASVTVAVITLAVAFLMNILAESLVKRAIASNTRERIQTSRKVYDWSSKLSSPGSPEALLAELAGADGDSIICKEARHFAALEAEEMEKLRLEAVDIISILNFFNDLDYAKRRTMIHTAEGLGILRRLSTADGREQFQTALSRIKSIHFVFSSQKLDEILAAFPDTCEKLDKILKGRAEAIAKVTAGLKGNQLLHALTDADDWFGDTIRAAGFLFDAEKTAPEVASQAKLLQDTLRLQKTMEIRVTRFITTKDAAGVESTEKKVELPMRQLIAQHANVLPADVNTVMMWKYMESKKFAARYLEKLKEVEERVAKEGGAVLEGASAEELAVAGLAPERLVFLANARTENTALVRAERLTMDAGKGFLGLGERLGWLLFVSMLVCGIGITNAMMMSVTERFNEIATLKCLGALDGFIMVMFVLESCFMGLVGGLIGALLGAFIGMSRMLVSFGSNFFAALPIVDILLGMLVSILLGTLLAAIAAVIPSYKAARLAPMEAMRVE